MASACRGRVRPAGSRRSCLRACRHHRSSFTTSFAPTSSRRRVRRDVVVESPATLPFILAFTVGAAGLDVICEVLEDEARAWRAATAAPIERSRPSSSRKLRSSLPVRRLRAGSSASRRQYPGGAPSIQPVDRERDREAERRHDADELAAVLERLGHHRVREHGQDRARREARMKATMSGDERPGRGCSRQARRAPRPVRSRSTSRGFAPSSSRSRGARMSTRSPRAGSR